MATDEELTNLLREDEEGVRAWFEARHLDLLHECPCGYTTYDDERVNEEVQGIFGGRRVNEIWDWAMSLNRFGWMDEVGGSPADGIYYCQYCDPNRRE